ncbi:MAG: phosphate signaling complex protein PhoU [Nitrospinae bacterium]|nr:phosphate signaling complex protein PhoU [Nitrospinota bacterium]
MRRHFDEDLKGLNMDIIKMATLAEEAIFKSIEALKNRDRGLAESVVLGDAKINDLELLIEEKIIDLLALRQPLARDLRFLTTGMKINAELERIADLASNIARMVIELVDKPILKPLIDIPKLSDVAIKMVKDSIDAFVDSDEKLAKEVMLYDSRANALRNLIQEELINDYMSKDASTVTRGIPLLLITRSLERICDHATNIAENVVYMINAKVLRHNYQYLENDADKE